MTGVKPLATGIAWSYGAQVLTAIAQFLYAAVTSRLIAPDGFGAYAIALVVSGLITLVANGGLGQSVARMQILDQSRLEGLATYALILGFIAAVVLFFTAQFWAGIWGDGSAAAPIKWLAISALLAPHIGLTSGLMRRLGHFKHFAVCTFITNIVGMVFGLVVLISTGSPVALIAAPIIAQLTLWLALTHMTERKLVRFGAPARARDDISFSWGVTLASVLSYTANNLGKWSVSRWVGAAALGQWNRSDVVTAVPFYQLQTAITQVVYPEFRHDRGDTNRAKRAWPDLLILVAWVTVPAGAVGSIILPYLVPVLFGPGWELAASLTAALSLICGVQVVTTVLGSAVEALGKFKWIWASQVLMIGIQIVAVAATILRHSVWPAVIATGVLAVARQAWYVWLCGRSGYIDVPRLLSGYLRVVAGTAYVGLLSWTLVNSIDSPIRVAAIALSAACAVLGVLSFRDSFPPLVILRRYGIVRNDE
ncbi:oligosaccharide flippase family protein [Rhodococcus sp. NPDC058639]|uniref:oligosaccharide flippase family protein n=1 Tax=Rhodococcus sp. NPDC058639 TaxID=3346570 RepID=UPI0036629CB6